MDDRKNADMRMAYAEVDEILKSPFWRSFIEKIEGFKKTAYMNMRDKVEPHLIYRGQGEITAYEKVLRLPEDIKNILRNKAGSAS